jgi:hypothetical protein
VIAIAPSHAPFSSAGPFREARLTGLEPNTTYHYSIGGGPDYSFKTAPPRGSSGFTIFAEGDIGDTGAYEEVGGVQALIASESPAFVLALGDLTYGDDHGTAAVDQHFNDMMVWSVNSAYMPAWGNHDWGATNDDLRNYKGRFDLPNAQTSPGSPAVSCCSEDWYWFDYGNARFIAYPEPFPGAWADWFTKAKAIMDDAQSDPAIAYIVTFGHRPAYSAGDYKPGDSQLRAYMDSLGVRHSKYVLNLNGHDHNYQRSSPQRGVVHITAGLGGAGLYSVDTEPWLVYGIAHHAALRLRFTQAGIDGRAICGPPGGEGVCTLGSTLDEFFIANRNPDRPPIVNVPANVRAAVGVPVTLTVAASDLDGDAIQSLVADSHGLPATFEVDPGNGSAIFTWTPGVADTGGSFPVDFTASNALVSTTRCVIRVAGADRPPVIAAPDPGLSAPGVRVSFAVHAQDPDGEPIASLLLDRSTLPIVNDATFTVTGDSVGTFSWTPTLADMRSEPYPVLFTASNALGAADTSTIVVASAPQILEKRIAAGADDAEENPSGSVSTSSSDLELVTDASVQVVGLRFSSLAIPPGAHVTRAYVQFQVDEANSETTSLTLRAQVADNAPAFTTASRNLSSRSRSVASQTWTPVAWTTIGQAGTNQRTPELASVIQEIVGRAGWRSGNALALIVNGSGHRTAVAFDGSAAAAPLLHVEFVTGPPQNQAPAVDAGPSRAITLPAEAALDGTVTDDGLPSGALSVTWDVVSGAGVVFTGGATVTDTRAMFPAAGRYVLRLTASDGLLSASDTTSVTASLFVPSPVTLEKRVASSADDAEEASTGIVTTSSSDLELVNDGNNQVVGLRFTGLAIPPNARVTRAWVQFKVDEVTSGTMALTVSGQAADNAAAFTTASRNVSSRSRTTASVAWAPQSWTSVGQVGTTQRTPDLAGVIQAIVSRSGWRSGNSLALIVTGAGRRTAESFDGDAGGAPLLHVELAAPAAAFALDEEEGEASERTAPDDDEQITEEDFANGRDDRAFPPMRGALGIRVIPNPTHGQATLQLVTAHAGPVRVELFDAAGRRVRVVLDREYLEAGPHAFDLQTGGDSSRLVPGVYFYRAIVRGGAGAGRFLLLE